MLKRELKINLKSLIIWTLILVGLFSMVYLIYPSIMNNANSNSLNDMLKSFPPEMLKMFNMDISGINTAFGWFKTEGYTFLLLLGGVFSAGLGSSILVKEESDKTIEFLAVKPVSRNKIITAKIVCALINITTLFLVVGIFNIVGMHLSDDLHLKDLVTLSFLPFLSSIVIFFITLFVSTFFRKQKKTYGLGLAIVFIGYFLQVISLMSDKVEFLKYITPFTLADARDIITGGSLSMIPIIITILLVGVLATATYYVYNKKDFE